LRQESILAYEAGLKLTLVENEMFLLDERVLVDVRAGLSGPSGTWRVQLYGGNITDEHYYTQTSRLTDTVVSYTGMPRTYGVQFSYRH